MRPRDAETIEEVAYRLAFRVKRDIESLHLPGAEYRRDLDGVSQDSYLIAKMIGEILTNGRADSRGLVRCNEEEP